VLSPSQAATVSATSRMRAINRRYTSSPSAGGLNPRLQFVLASHGSQILLAWFAVTYVSQPSLTLSACFHM
jgi:hypothetical protein